MDRKSKVGTLKTWLIYSRSAQVFLEIKQVKKLNGFYREIVLFIVKISSSSNIHVYAGTSQSNILILSCQPEKIWTLLKQTIFCSLQNTVCGGM